MAFTAPSLAWLRQPRDPVYVALAACLRALDSRRKGFDIPRGPLVRQKGFLGPACAGRFDGIASTGACAFVGSTRSTRRIGSDIGDVRLEAIRRILSISPTRPRQSWGDARGLNTTSWALRQAQWASILRDVNGPGGCPRREPQERSNDECTWAERPRPLATQLIVVGWTIADHRSGYESRLRCGVSWNRARPTTRFGDPRRRKRDFDDCGRCYVAKLENVGSFYFFGVMKCKVMSDFDPKNACHAIKNVVPNAHLALPEQPRMGIPGGLIAVDHPSPIADMAECDPAFQRPALRPGVRRRFRV